MNLIKAKNKRQQKHEKTIVDIRFLCNSVETFQENLSPKQFSIFKEILYFYIHCNRIFPSHETLAARVGCCTKTVQRAIKYFEFMGLLVRHKRDKGRGWLYKISSWFKSFAVRKKLALLFPVLAIGLPVLTSMANNVLEQHTEKRVHLKNNISKESISTKDKNLLKSSYFIIPVPVACDTTRTHTREDRQRSTKNQEVVMQAEFSPILDQLPFKLTLYGKIKMSAIPDGVIKTVSDNLSYSDNLKDAGDFLFKRCLDYMQSNKMVPLWKRYYELYDMHNKPPHGFLAEKIEKTNKSSSETVYATGSKPYSGFVPADYPGEVKSRAMLKEQIAAKRKHDKEWCESEEGKRFIHSPLGEALMGVLRKQVNCISDEEYLK